MTQDPFGSDEGRKCDRCGEPAWLTRYNLAIEDAMERRAAGFEVQPDERWCKECYFESIAEDLRGRQS